MEVYEGIWRDMKVYAGTWTYMKVYEGIWRYVEDIRVYAGFTMEENDYGNLDSRDRKLPVEEGIRRFGDVAVEYIFDNWVTIRPMYRYLIRRDSDIGSDEVIRREIERVYGIDFSLFEGSSASDYTFVLSLKRELRTRLFDSRRTRNYVDLNVRYVF